MRTIAAELLDTYRKGDRRLMLATDAGTTPARTKEGDVEVPYRPGDAILGSADNLVICGPVSPSGAIDLAERILDGDQRAVTDPLAILALAVAVVAFQRPAAQPLHPETGAQALPAPEPHGAVA